MKVKNFKENNFCEKVNRILYKIAKNYDFYLLNNLNLSIDGKRWKCSHLLISDKFIYCVNDKYFEGKLEGTVDDNKWIYTLKDNIQKEQIINPVMNNRKRAFILNEYLTHKNEDAGLVVPISVLNDKTDVPINITLDSKARNEIIHIKDLKDFILNYEDNNKIANIQANDLERMVGLLKKYTVLNDEKDELEKSLA